MVIVFETTIPILRIFNVAKAKEFYIDLLGFTMDWEHRFDETAPVYLQISRNGFALHLTEHHGDCCPGSTVFVWMNGIEEFLQEIACKKQGFVRPSIETTFYNSKSMVLTDPFGNRIRLNESLKSNG
jgi:uncharacterized glyoxalase superfamily protein PhnB